MSTACRYVWDLKSTRFHAVESRTGGSPHTTLVQRVERIKRVLVHCYNRHIMDLWTTRALTERYRIIMGDDYFLY